MEQRINVLLVKLGKGIEKVDSRLRVDFPVETRF
jgi:hypothetical protein